MRFLSGHQPHYLPSVSYFAKIMASDVFVFSDDVKYVGKDWQNRNRVLAPDVDRGWKWLIAPVQGGDDGAMIFEKKLAGGRWPEKHARTLQQMYEKMPGWHEVEPFAQRIARAREGNSLAGLCADLIWLACNVLGIGIRERCVWATELRACAQNTPDTSEKIAEQMRALWCDGYISGPSGPDYLDTSFFPARSISIFRWEPTPYGSLPDLSIVDLIAHKGTYAAAFLGHHWLEDWP